jgi:hypothetical protein
VGDGDAGVEARQRAGQRGRGVALHDDPVGPLGCQPGLEAQQRGGGDGGQRLPRPHQREIVVGPQAEVAERQVEQFPVLPGRDDGAVHAGPGAQALDDGGELDRLRPGAEDAGDAERRLDGGQGRRAGRAHSGRDPVHACARPG